MNHSSPNDHKAIETQVNTLVNASILRRMKKMVDEVKEDEKLKRKILIYFFVSLALIFAVFYVYIATVQPLSLPAKAATKYPKKVVIEPSTKDIALAAYYLKTTQRIESKGNEYLAANKEKAPHGEVIVSIPINQDGSIYEREGGVKVERSSGNAKLDELALMFAKQAAPFSPFGANSVTTEPGQIRIIFTRMKLAGVDIK